MKTENNLDQTLILYFKETVLLFDKYSFARSSIISKIITVLNSKHKKKSKKNHFRNSTIKTNRRFILFGFTCLIFSFIFLTFLIISNFNSNKVTTSPYWIKGHLAKDIYFSQGAKGYTCYFNLEEHPNLKFDLSKRIYNQLPLDERVKNTFFQLNISESDYRSKITKEEEKKWVDYITFNLYSVKVNTLKVGGEIYYNHQSEEDQLRDLKLFSLLCFNLSIISILLLSPLSFERALPTNY
ncbi:hypothetical protein [Flammeovirga sp. SJP92]|uniref:hypothetical protein n=1 Tax=Flammeovirga sp. SJP92 TaxID=1775430 RepID=UPI0012FB6DB1|nr:hypothetical protein [Flammeovirga sp. SJP92]